MTYSNHATPVSSLLFDISFLAFGIPSEKNPKKFDISQASGAFREMLFASIVPWRQLMGAMICSYIKKGGET